MSSESLAPYRPVSRWPDPDVADPRRAPLCLQEGAVHVALSVSSDQDGDATVSLAWIQPGMGAWESADITRTPGSDVRQPGISGGELRRAPGRSRPGRRYSASARRDSSPSSWRRSHPKCGSYPLRLAAGPHSGYTTGGSSVTESR